MKKSKLAIIALVSLAICLIPVIAFLVPPRAGGMSIKVGVYEMHPKVFTDEGGKWVGFWPDIMEYIAEKEGWSIEYIEGTWSECIDRVEHGEIDIMVDVAYEKEREQDLVFNNVSVFSNWGVIYGPEHGHILSFEDLTNKTVAVMNGSIHTNGTFGIVNMNEKFGINCTYVLTENYVQVFEMIENETVDAGVVNRLFGLSNADKYEVVQTSLIFNPIDLKFTFPRDAELNGILIPRIDHHLIELIGDPGSIYYRSIERHFLGLPVVEKVPEWLLSLIISVSFLVFAFISMSVYLDRKVKQKTRELRDTNLQLELVNKVLLDSIPSGVLLVDEGGDILLINQLMKELLHHDNGESSGPVNLFSNKERNELVSAMKNVFLNTIERNANAGKQTVALEGSTHLELFSTHLELKRPQKRGVVLFVVNDVTPFVEIDKMRRQFVSMVSHELRTPLTAINVSLYNLIKFRTNLNEEKLEKTLDIMQRNANSLATMLEDLIIAGSIETATITIEKANCNLKEIVEKTTQELEHLLKHNKMTMKVEIPGDMAIRADPRRISQVVRILLDNAVKYSHPGSEIKVEGITGYQGSSNPEGVPGVLVKFIDHGIGIPRKDIPLLFQTFRRASNVGDASGSGLGLSIAKSLVELHDGTISVESKQDLGSTFSIFLPDTS